MQTKPKAKLLDVDSINVFNTDKSTILHCLRLCNNSWRVSDAILDLHVWRITSRLLCSLSLHENRRKTRKNIRMPMGQTMATLQFKHQSHADPETKQTRLDTEPASDI